MSKGNSTLIPAVGFLRKSTKGERDGKQRQEKSIDQQKEEVIKLAKAGGYQILRWYVDAGVSGWKPGRAAKVLRHAGRRQNERRHPGGVG